MRAGQHRERRVAAGDLHVDRRLVEPPEGVAPRRPLRDPKSALQEWAQGRGLPTPAYTIVDQSGPNHAPRFTIRVTVSGTDAATGIGASKRAAEQEAARSLLLREGVWTEDLHGVV